MQCVCAQTGRGKTLAVAPVAIKPIAEATILAPKGTKHSHKFFPFFVGRENYREKMAGANGPGNVLVTFRREEALATCLIGFTL